MSTSVHRAWNVAAFNCWTFVIDGKKYELQSELAIGKVVALGNYKAKLITNRKSAYESLQVYEFLMPDKTRQYEVVGQSE